MENPEEANQQGSSVDITAFIAEAPSNTAVVSLDQWSCFPFTLGGLESSDHPQVTSHPAQSILSSTDGMAETGSPGAAYDLPEKHATAGAFFMTRMGSRNTRAIYLARALQGLIGAMELDGERYVNLWSSRETIFSGSGTGPVARFRRLFHALLQVRRGRDDYDCASRLCHIFLEHDLEQLEKSGHLRVSRGRGRKSAALSMQAASISASVEAVKTDRKAGRRYMQVLMDAGPGLLLMLGSQRWKQVGKEHSKKYPNVSRGVVQLAQMTEAVRKSRIGKA
ncbi:hypothetical protein N7485_004577 [Penicillium canescens]|nr:hypothetical protein N7485_004577 [Penicillium canescens]